MSSAVWSPKTAFSTSSDRTTRPAPRPAPAMGAASNPPPRAQGACRYRSNAYAAIPTTIHSTTRCGASKSGSHASSVATRSHPVRAHVPRTGFASAKSPANTSPTPSGTIHRATLHTIGPPRFRGCRHSHRPLSATSSGPCSGPRTSSTSQRRAHTSTRPLQFPRPTIAQIPSNSAAIAPASTDGCSKNAGATPMTSNTASNPSRRRNMPPAWITTAARAASSSSPALQPITR